ncbi:zinc finger protein 436-like [Pseudophryne corroboree]|uniref:zinc finger protein 436-like n=1 Tax=Pseudophryne corroboree TaxID=495146 RepID=UPI003081771C
MMENHRPLTSLDGPSNRDTPERCHHPLYSQDCTEENHRIPQEDQEEELTDFMAEDTEGEEETHVSDLKAEDTEGEEATYVSDMKAEDIKGEEETYVSDMKAEDLEREETYVTNMRAGDTKEEEMYVRDAKQEEEKPSDISTGGNNTRNTSEGHVVSFPDFKFKDENITRGSPDGNLNIHPAFHSADISSDPYIPEECSPSNSNIAAHSTDRNSDRINKYDRSHTGKKLLKCSECGELFTRKSLLVIHQGYHTGEKPFPHSERGKCFTQKSHQVKHKRSHTGVNPFSCYECGEWFPRKTLLVRHRGYHTAEKPSLCYEHGDFFTQKSDLVAHE